jgi:hypothetical protein
MKIANVIFPEFLDFSLGIGKLRRQDTKVVSLEVVIDLHWVEIGNLPL